MQWVRAYLMKFRRKKTWNAQKVLLSISLHFCTRIKESIWKEPTWEAKKFKEIIKLNFAAAKCKLVFLSYLEIFPKCSLSILFFTVKSWIFVSALAIDGSISFSRSSLFFWASSYNWLVRSFDWEALVPIPPD